MGINSKLASLLLLWMTFSSVFGQESQSLRDNHYYFPSPSDYFDWQLYGLAIHQTESLKYDLESIELQANNSFALDETRSIDLLLETLSRDNDIQRNADIYFKIANKYFEKRDYDHSKLYWNNIDPLNLDLNQRSVMQFKLAYCYLVEKNFNEALPLFKNVENSNSVLSEHGAYYSGICSFYLNDRENALASFKKVERSSKYKNLIPFYLSQIYFKEQEYDEAIKYAESRLKSSSSDKHLLERILGMSYVALEEYDKALPHLENYSKETKTISENDAYQIGVTYYKLGNYKQAQSYFKELSYQDSPIGQMSNFLLASTSVENNQKKDAQSAFKQASKLDYFPEIQEESEFLYYKISAELNDERVAINGLSKVSSNSKYYSESQTLLAGLLNNSDDVHNSILVIENIEYKSQELQDTYRRLCYDDGMSKLKDNDIKAAIVSFEKSLSVPSSSISDAELYFRLGQANQESQRLDSSNNWFDKYIQTGEKKYQFETYYSKAYLSMENKKYDQAIENLENALEHFDVDSDDKLYFDDVLVRLADLELVKNNYNAALEYYELAINNEAEASDYILYQKALIYGVNNQVIEKLTSLEKLLKKYAQSSYRDDALFQLGETLVELGKNNQAYQVYNSVIIEYGKDSPYASISHMRQGLISYNQGDLYAALNSYKQGVAICQDNDEKRRAIKAIEDIYLYDLNEANEFFKYKESLTGVTIGDIQKDSIVFSIALDIYKNAEYEKAITKFEEYLNNKSYSFFALDAKYYLAESYLVLKSYPKALNNYEKVLEQKGSKYYESSLKKAAVIAYNFAQDFEMSFRYYNELIDKTLPDVSLEYLEAALYSAFKIENSSAVLRYGEMVIQNNSATQESKSAAHYYMAKVYYQSKKYDASYNQFKLVSELSKNNQAAESSYFMSRILFDQKKYTEAEEQAFSTATSSSNYPYWVSKSILLLAEIYTINKDYINATAAYESIIENFKDNAEVLNEAKVKLEELKKIIKQESRISDSEDSEFMKSDSLIIKQQ